MPELSDSSFEEPLRPSRQSGNTGSLDDHGDPSFLWNKELLCWKPLSDQSDLGLSMLLNICGGRPNPGQYHLLALGHGGKPLPVDFLPEDTGLRASPSPMCL